MEGNQIFSAFLKAVEENESVREGIRAAEESYNIRAYCIGEISCEEALKLYNSIYSKFYKKNNHQKSANWFENELRLFVWILISYAHLHQRKLEELGPPDWRFFEQIFDRKDPKLFEYQTHCLYLLNKGKQWGRLEEDLLKQIMAGSQARNSKIKWNEVSKELFQQSNKEFLRTPKQCRQRWNNHLDPSKVKGMWRREEYILMFEFVRRNGKKWASLVKELGYTRNEHSIKNKFNSMVKRHRKSINEREAHIAEEDLYAEIIEKVNSAISNERNCKNRNDIEFDLDDDDEVRPAKRQALDKKPSSYAEKLMQKLMKFGDASEGPKKREPAKIESQGPKAERGEALKMEEKPSFKNSLGSSSQMAAESDSCSEEQNEQNSEDDSLEEQNGEMENLQGEHPGLRRVESLSNSSKSGSIPRRAEGNGVENGKQVGTQGTLPSQLLASPDRNPEECQQDD